MAYAKVEPYFDNTTMQAYYNMKNELRNYIISPCEGYVLHSSSRDKIVYDKETGEPTGEVIPGFTKAAVSVGCSYDFEKNPREIYAVLESTVTKN